VKTETCDKSEEAKEISPEQKEERKPFSECPFFRPRTEFVGERQELPSPPMNPMGMSHGPFHPRGFFPPGQFPPSGPFPSMGAPFMGHPQFPGMGMEFWKSKLDAAITRKIDELMPCIVNKVKNSLEGKNEEKAKTEV